MLTAFAEQVVNGLMLGSVYVFVALGMMLIYGVMHVLNFAHGALFTLGAYVALLVFTRVVDNYLLAILAAVAVLVLVGAVLERAVFAPLRDNLRNQVIASLGLVLVIQNGIVALLGPNALQFPVAATRATVAIGPLSFALQHLLIIATGFASVALLFAFLHLTRYGTALRAVAQNPAGALVVGINVAGVHRTAFALSMALASGRLPLADFAVSPDHAAIIRACGGRGWRVERAGDLAPVLEEAIEAVRCGTQALVSVRVA